MIEHKEKGWRQFIIVVVVLFDMPFTLTIEHTELTIDKLKMIIQCLWKCQALEFLHFQHS